MAIDPMSGAGGNSAVRRFTVQAGLVLAVFTTVVVIGIYARTATLVMRGVEAEAASYLDLIVTARQWNAGYDGVWVIKGAGVETNPYLERLGVQAETVTVSGAEMTLRNPAAMTRELSTLTAEKDGVTFNMTSLDPVNPGNRPDAWEAQQLARFEQGVTEASTVEKAGGKRQYRLMRPLVTTSSCLRCHSVQGYAVGDIRGAITVSVPLAARDSELASSARWLAALWVVIIAGLGVIMWALVTRMRHSLERGEAQLRHIAVTDTLTGLLNRRATMSRLAEEVARAGREHNALGVIAGDIDWFKRVNDTYGHMAGDRVLHSVAVAMQDSTREYDVVGRMGGEEFLVVAPDVTPTGLTALAERVRESVNELKIELPDGSEAIAVTLSLGCAIYREGEHTDVLLRRADDALYAAKDAGRNQVVMAD